MIGLIKMNRFISQIIPFILFGILLVLFVVGIILFSYLLILGAVVGLVLFIIQWIRMKFFPSKHLSNYQHSKRSGRTFDHRK